MNEHEYALSVRHVSHWFGTHKVLSDVNFDIEPGQIVAIVGPSGCGKSTLLRAILGTHPPKQGEIWTSGHLVTAPNRDVGIVYQHYSLYDFLTAQKNVAFGLLLDETSLRFRALVPWKWWRLRRKHLREAEQFLDKVHLPASKHLYPHEMSGGMRQRVAIAQALIMKPQILLLDEPFGALDEATREELQLMLLELYQENLKAKADERKPPYTIVIVTHELNEAIYVSDRILGLSQYHSEGGQGSRIVYDQPAPAFHPEDLRDFAKFQQQKEELRKYVFDPKTLQDHNELVSYWQDRQSQAELRSPK
jgi:NitT/TauT family transport system ATP-binding protein